MPGLLKVLSPVKNHVADGTPVVVGTAAYDAVLVDEYGSVSWVVTCRRTGAGSRAERFRLVITAVHDGSAVADAVDGNYEISGGAATGASSSEITFAVALSGAGASQVLQLVATTAVPGWSIDVSRDHHVGSPL